ncbi:hypothetical protein LP420_11090 [Massilia sp. B-10]|nr:hypothetical protein LP420_11090 [Massilia sp. B-10]
MYIEDSDPVQPGVIFTLEPWTAPLDLMTTRVGQAAAFSAGLIGNKGQPYDEVVAVETTCTARDGAKVPISILMKKSVKQDGSNPTFLEGYAKLRQHHYGRIFADLGGMAGAGRDPGPGQPRVAAAPTARSGTRPGAARPSPIPGTT